MSIENNIMSTLQKILPFLKREGSCFLKGKFPHMNGYKELKLTIGVTYQQTHFDLEIIPKNPKADIMNLILLSNIINAGQRSVYTAVNFLDGSVTSRVILSTVCLEVLTSDLVLDILERLIRMYDLSYSSFFRLIEDKSRIDEEVDRVSKIQSII